LRKRESTRAKTALGLTVKRVVVVALIALTAVIAALAFRVAAPSGSSRAESSPARACVVKRWKVKTLQDRPRLRPLRVTTIGDLVTRRRPRRLPSTRLPFERGVFQVKGAVTLVGRGRDGELQLVVRDGENQMVAKAPSSGCTKRATPVRRRQMARARHAVRPCTSAVVTGVAFFAPNGIELHPLLGFRCSSRQSGAVVAMATGDFTGCRGSSCSSSSNSKAVHDLIAKEKPEVFLALGDFQYGDIGGILNGWNLMYGPKPNGLYPKAAPTAGPTHDVTSCTDSRYESYFGRRAEKLYSFDAGTWHIISLPSSAWRYGCDTAGITAALKADLAAHRTECTLAFLHEPYWTRPTSEHSRTSAEKPWIQALYNAGVEILLQAHNHNYQRFAPQDPNDNLARARGIRAFVVGTGGVGLYRFSGSAPNVEESNDTTYGALKLTLHNGSYDFEFIRAAGASFTDAGSGTCH
jgi:hypothetical protein